MVALATTVPISNAGLSVQIKVLSIFMRSKTFLGLLQQIKTNQTLKAFATGVSGKVSECLPPHCLRAGPL